MPMPMLQTMDLRCALPMLAACAAVALTGCRKEHKQIDPHVKAASFSFDPSVAPRDREWILAAVANVRPEARQLIDDVDGMVTISTYSEPDGRAVGTAQQIGPARFQVRFNLAYLDGDRRTDRDAVVVHELGHVIIQPFHPILAKILVQEQPQAASHPISYMHPICDMRDRHIVHIFFLPQEMPHLA